MWPSVYTSQGVSFFMSITDFFLSLTLKTVCSHLHMILSECVHAQSVSYFFLLHMYIHGLCSSTWIISNIESGLFFFLMSHSKLALCSVGKSLFYFATWRCIWNWKLFALLSMPLSKHYCMLSLCITSSVCLYIYTMNILT